MVLKVYSFQKRAFLRSMELTNVSIDANVALAKQKQTKWCLVPKILFWLKFSVKTVNVHESVLSRKLVFDEYYWKRAIKYDLYVKFPQIFATEFSTYLYIVCENSFLTKNFN